jgi:hypothetical protein
MGKGKEAYIFWSRSSRREEAVKGLATCIANMDLLSAGVGLVEVDGKGLVGRTLQFASLFFSQTVLCACEIEIALGAANH